MMNNCEGDGVEMLPTRNTGQQQYQPRRQQSFNQLYFFAELPAVALWDKIKKLKDAVLSAAFVTRLFPMLGWLQSYHPRQDLTSDVISGLTVGVMHLPQGLAYAMLAGVPPITGLYMAFFPVIIYSIMGTSRHVSMGTFSVVCIMTSNAVSAFSSTDSIDAGSSNATLPTLLDPCNEDEVQFNYTPVEVATAVCFTVGIVQFVMGVCKLGKLSVLLSDTLVSGFTTAAAIHVLVSQLKNLTGIAISDHNGIFKCVHVVHDLFVNLKSVNFVTLGISLGTIIFLWIYTKYVKTSLDNKCHYPFPVELVTILIGTAISYLCDLENRFGVNTVGNIPIGLPSPTPPPFRLIPYVVTDSIVIAAVGYSISLSMASILARKGKYMIDANQELLASGAGNIFASFFACVPFAASLSRSLIQQNVGGKTQIASLVSCCFLLLILLVIGPVFESLPNCILASIVVVALKKMFEQFGDFIVAWKKSHLDGGVWLCTFVASVLLDIDYGLAIGLALSVCSVVHFGQKLVVLSLGRVPHTDLYLDLKHYLAAKEVPGICIIQIAGGLHYANREFVLRKCYRIIGVSSKLDVIEPDCSDDCENENHIQVKLHCLVLDLQGLCFLDPTAADALIQLQNDLISSRGIHMLIANCPPAIMKSLQNYHFFTPQFSEENVFPSVHDAVCHAGLLHHASTVP